MSVVRLPLTFKALQVAAAKMELSHNNLGSRVDNILDRARINADDTVYVEKAAPVSEYDAIALASVSSILSYTDDKSAVRWFTRHGITF